MLFDNYLLSCMMSGYLSMPLLRVYGWSEQTLSLGANQNLDKDFTSCFRVVKRITGGQSVLHDLPADELTYSVVIHYGNKIKKLYFEIGNVLMYLLRKYGLNPSFGYSDKDYVKNFNCFDSKTSSDIVVNNIKIIGSAQCRKKECILQHGSIRLDKIRQLSAKQISFNDASNDLKLSFEEVLKIKFVDFSIFDNSKEALCKASGE